ncbi:hypothetical protein LHK_01643 [Laribacter hongkongensis HLHK9]|uniref:Uncharacterized protein n=1 Tax=Laribacter hongkongensis (strain HLHK9) TaxID=557598 RepID=C1D840_LARHH|nr:hypothetical protein [Laribacter hongkongensis]ACO74629.1 hypothetical protein LHK_01643 [Laribacter hongkongensis HLHK9]
MNEIKTEETSQADESITLSDGRKASIAHIKGIHIRKARKMANEAGIDYQFALLAQIVTIDGHPIADFDLDEMRGTDVITLQLAAEKKM